MVDLGPLNDVLAHVRRRLRLQHALEGLAVTAVLGLLALAGAVVAVRLDAPWWRLPVAVAGGLLALGGLGGGLRRVPLERAAHRLDTSHGLKSRVQSALDFAARTELDPFMRAALQDAIGHAPQLSAQTAVPWQPPRSLPFLAPAGALLALAALVPLPRGGPPDDPAAAARAVAPAQLDEETLDAFRQDLARVAQQHATPSEDVASYVELLDALERGELTREEALAALAELQRGLARRSETYTRVVRQGLARAARGLGDGRLTEALARALAEGDAETAAEALEELQKRLARGKLDRREREALRRALERAARQHDETEPELLRRERERGAADDEPSLLRDPEERERQLEQLRREREAEQRARRQLEQLRRELNRASQQGTAGTQGMQGAADSLREMARDGMSAEQQRELAEQMEQLRQQLQRQQQRGGAGQGRQQQRDPQGGGGESQQQRMQRFRLQAGGRGGSQGQEKSMPMVAPRGPDAGRDGGSREGGGGGGRDGGEDAGADAARQEVLQLGGEGEPNATLEMPGLGGREQRSQQSTQGGGGGGKPEPRPDADLADSQLAGVAAQGPSRSQVILGAADQGFANAPYGQVYEEYRSHAEGVLERDEIPPGYRFYVRRYFQLIRPREGSQNE